MLRLIEVVLPEQEAGTIGDFIDMDPHGGPWREPLHDGRHCVRFVVDGEESGEVVDEIERRFGNVAGFHLLILPVHGALPRPTDVEAEKRRFGSKRGGLSREELYTEAQDMARPTKVFYATVTHEIDVRTGVHWSDILLALAAGSAGALALTTGVPTALVGVMVAVALLPPTAVLGLMLGSGSVDLAGGAALLLAVNLICVNLAAMATFLAQGIRPRTWWQADRALRATRIAMAIGIVLIAILLSLIFVRQTG